MKLSLSLIFALLVVFGLNGCVSTTVTPTSDKHYAAFPDSSNVRVFASERDIKQNYEVLGIVEHSDVGKYQNITLEKVLPELKKKARKMGANALIIDQSTPTKSGIFSRGIDVRVRAIRLQL